MRRSHYSAVSNEKTDKSVRIWRLEMDGARSQAILMVTFTEHNSEVWRVQWNITGTILASSGDDGNVRLYQCDFVDNSWKCIRTIAADK